MCISAVLSLLFIKVMQRTYVLKPFQFLNWLAIAIICLPLSPFVPLCSARKCVFTTADYKGVTLVPGNQHLLIHVNGRG